MALTTTDTTTHKPNVFKRAKAKISKKPTTTTKTTTTNVPKTTTTTTAPKAPVTAAQPPAGPTVRPTATPTATPTAVPTATTTARPMNGNLNNTARATRGALPGAVAPAGIAAATPNAVPPPGTKMPAPAAVPVAAPVAVAPAAVPVAEPVATPAFEAPMASTAMATQPMTTSMKIRQYRDRILLRMRRLLVPLVGLGALFAGTSIGYSLSSRKRAAAVPIPGAVTVVQQSKLSRFMQSIRERRALRKVTAATAAAMATTTAPVATTQTTVVQQTPAIAPATPRLAIAASPRITRPITSAVQTNERLVASERLPVERIIEYDVVTRKRVPYHEVREVYEGAPTVEVEEVPAREYIVRDQLPTTTTTTTTANAQLV